MEYIITVDLPQQKVILPDNSEYLFEIDPYRKKCLIEGMDDLDYLLSRREAIKQFDTKHTSNLFIDTTKI